VKNEFPYAIGVFKCAGLILQQELFATELVTFLNSREAPLKKLVKASYVRVMIIGEGKSHRNELYSLQMNMMCYCICAYW
jgi:hypothetical protein